MRLRLESVVSWVGLVTAVAYCLGWLKTLYYFDAFGVGLSALELSPKDYLFESWFVLENAIFFLLLAWIVVTSGRVWLWTVGLIYSLVPIAAHYAFLDPDQPLLRELILYRHTILKMVPFVVLIGLCLVDLVRKRPLLKAANELRWSHGQGALVVFVLVVAAWSISVAKHFGSFDANRAMLWPDEYLARVSLRVKEPNTPASGADGSELYVVFENEHRLFLWDRSGFTFGNPGGSIKMLTVPRDAVLSMQTTKPHRVQIGSLFF
jgi:hypothetical protein